MASASPSITTRRGRGSFRPLSITDTSTLFPFDFDPVRTMEAVYHQQSALVTGVTELRGRVGETTTPTISQDSASHDATDQVNQTEEEFPVTALLTTPEDDPRRGKSVVIANFLALLNTTPPDLGQHPALQPNPKNSTSDCPLLITRSSPEQIRQWAHQRRNVSKRSRERTNSSSSGEESVPEEFFIVGKQNRPDVETDIFEILAEGLPVPIRRAKPPHPVNAQGSFLPSVSETFEQQRPVSSIRTFSHLFKPRESIEKSALPSSPDAPLEKPDRSRDGLVTSSFDQ